MVQAAAGSLPQPAKIGLPFEGNSSAPISIAKIIKQAIMFAGILAVMAITYGGILMMLSYGDESKVKGAKNIIQYALIGIVLLFVFLGSMAMTISPSFAISQSDLLVGGGSNSAEANTTVDIQSDFLKTIQVYLLGAYAVIAIGSMIFIGFKLFTAKGDPGEFKKAWIAFVYIAMGLAIAPLAYVVVRIVSGFSF